MLAFLAQVSPTASPAAEKTLKVLPETGEVILGLIFFAILFIGLAKLAFPKLREILATRTARIQGQLEEAERTKLQADQLLEQYRAQLAGARAEVQKIIEEGKRTADSLRADLVAKAEQEAQEIVRRAQADVAGERDRAMQELQGTLGRLSIELAAKVIEQDLRNDEAARALVDKAIQDLGREPSGTQG